MHADVRRNEYHKRSTWSTTGIPRLCAAFTLRRTQDKFPHGYFSSVNQLRDNVAKQARDDPLHSEWSA